MLKQQTYKKLIAIILTGILAAFAAGCDSGSGSQAELPVDSPFVENYIEIAAIPGPIVAVRVGQVAVLDDTRSYALSAEPLSYSWSFAYKPVGSNAELQGPETASPSFTPDIRGVYMVQLVVSAEGVNSQRAITTVVVTNPGERLTGRFNHLGLSSNCVNCHDGVNLRSNGKLLFPKTPDHVATSNTCQACHTPQGFNIIPFADHQEVFGNCSQCHNGIQAVGKSEFHAPTEAECDDCHNTISFLELAADGSFDHSNIVRSCNGCHNGTVATGKTASTADTPPGTHPDTNAECGNCHTTASFLNAYPDHTDPAVTGAGCDSCHVADGSGSATGQTIGHPVTNVDCDTCHSTITFKMPGGIFNHSLVDPAVQACESCHTASNSINASIAPQTSVHLNTTSDCAACHSTASFNPAFSIDHTDPLVIAQRCDACHGVSATGKPLSTPFYEHMPTTEDCKVCHTPGTFSTGTFSHSGPSFVGSCDSCHNNVIGAGKLPNHIPTTPGNQDCAECHTTATFTGAAFDHTSTDTSNCLACHDGNISSGKSFGHVATDLNCSSCHVINNGYSTFANTFDHDPFIVGNDCASCHNTGIATPKTVDHIPSQAECSQCHNDMNTGGFISSSFLTSVHPGIISGCEGCHNNRFISNPLLLKANNHLPTAQDCNVCHTNTAFSVSIFSHAGITGNCTSCHDGSSNHVAAGALGKAQASNPHPATSADCGACHAIGNNFTDGTFDHSGIVNNCSSCHGDNPTAAPAGPGMNPGHLPTVQDCSVCHVTGTFRPAAFDHAGIIDNCTQCHGDNATAAVTKKNPGHVATALDCSVCHNTSAFAGARFDHTGIVNDCASCHDGATARGKTPPPNHVPTNSDCSVCHQTTGFIPGNFDHTGIVDNCSSCHDGAFAIGKTNGHVLTNQDCSVCHTTASFVGAGFNHTGIVDNCASCHDGVTAMGMEAKTNPPHIATALDCSSCHTTASFIGGTWTHDASTAGNCDQCHSPGGGANSIKLPDHLSTTVQCDVCHTTDGWAPTSFNHSPQGGYPGDHRRDPGCSGCHGNTISLPFNYPFGQYAPDCAACHANDFESKDKHIGGKNGTVEQNRDCAGSGCHSIRDDEFG